MRVSVGIAASVLAAACSSSGTTDSSMGSTTCAVSGVAVSASPATMNTGATSTLTASLNWTNMSATNELTGKDLARRPHNLASAVLTWQPLPGATLGGSLTYEGKRFNDNANFTPDHDYLILRINPDVTSYTGASTQRYTVSDNGMSATTYPTALVPQIDVNFTPEPSALGAIGLVGLGLLRRRPR